MLEKIVRPFILFHPARMYNIGEIFLHATLISFIKNRTGWLVGVKKMCGRVWQVSLTLQGFLHNLAQLLHGVGFFDKVLGTKF